MATQTVPQSVAFAEYNENKTIFVNNLPTSVTETVLFAEVFKDFPNQVSNVHINRDSRFDTTIAYINMNSHEAALQAIKKLNGTLIEGKKVNMFWSLRDFKQRTQNETNLYVKYIKKSVTQQKLQEVFEKYGHTLSVKLSSNEKNESNGFGYVKYCTVEECQAAVDARDEIAKEIGDEGFLIAKFCKQPKNLKTNLYIGNIDKTVTEEQFLKYFETFGPIKCGADGKKFYRFLYDEKYEKNKGFVNYENTEDAQKAVTAPRHCVLGDSDILVTYYKTKKERKQEFKQHANEIKMNATGKYKEYNFHVKTDKAGITEGEIRDALQDCGGIYSIKIKYVNSEPTDVVYICFDNAQSAHQFIQKAQVLGWTANPFKTKQERSSANNYYNGTGIPGFPVNFLQYFQLFPSVFNTSMNRQPKPGNKQPRNVSASQNAKKKSKVDNNIKKQSKSIEKAPTVTEEMKNNLGDQLYDFILGIEDYDEEITGRITGVLLESIEYSELNNMLKNKIEELKSVIKEVHENLKKINN
ncbi:hypothetical protein ENUP19_0259G0040 [Entamoeba nuttalli]|uniref:Polyadenylate-binding protein, putative n=2 Tax=Entamoeba nuttalli TaxID=412467 RepID=K2H4W3_ENTNP|nr:polyadenylate-binding protein, putative [Entamoeba nuttalli P19]EKE37514.1 polyadenylate-binding protein, putative [Entamoeba nuttalli P19]|eukprot:XP_008860140.1 polyadenylate-binding protein, putative [Entamoeba nuttalli P19]